MLPERFAEQHLRFYYKGHDGVVLNAAKRFALIYLFVFSRCSFDIFGAVIFVNVLCIL